MNGTNIRCGDMVAGRDPQGKSVTGIFQSLLMKQGPRFEAAGTALNVAVVLKPDGQTAHIDCRCSPILRIIK